MLSLRDRLTSQIWKFLIVGALIVYAVAALYSWSLSGFETPTPLWVFKATVENVAAFGVFVGLVALSFALQYAYDSPIRRRMAVRAKTPILVLLGIGLMIVTMVWRWLIDGSSSSRMVVSDTLGQPVVVGSSVGLVAAGFVLAFVLSSRAERRRVSKTVLIAGSALLMFVGPTYLIYGMESIGAVPYPALALSALTTFIVGAYVFLRLLEKEAKS